MKSPEPSCSPRAGSRSIVSMSSRDSSVGSNPSSDQSRYKMRKGKHQRSSTTPTPLAQVQSLSLSLRALVELEVFLPMGQGLAETMSRTPGYLTSLAKKFGRFGSQGLMTLPPAEGGTMKNNLMYFCPKCKVLPVIMSLVS